MGLTRDVLCRVSHKMYQVYTKKKNTGTNWISDARRHATTGETRRAKICIEEDEHSIEPTSNETYNKLAAMFPLEKSKHILCPSRAKCNESATACLNWIRVSELGTFVSSNELKIYNIYIYYIHIIYTYIYPLCHL